MPTVLLADGFRFYFFSNEGSEPPHVHVRRGQAVAKLWLDALAFAYEEGLHPAERRRVRELAFANRAMFLTRWYEHFER